MNVRHYAPFFDDASYHLWTRVGLPYSRMIAEHSVHCVTASAKNQRIELFQRGRAVWCCMGPVIGVPRAFLI